MGVLAARLAADLATAKLAADLREADSLLYGLTTFTGGTNYYATQSGAGEAGVATGFGFATLFQMSVINGASNNPLVSRDLGAAGWIHYFGSAGALLTAIANSVPVFVSSPSRQVVASDVGKIFLAIGLHTGASGFSRHYVDRDERGTGTAISGYTAAAAPHLIAKSANFTTNLSLWPILAHMTFRGVPTLAQIQDYYDRARYQGDLPDTIQGATITHHWSARRTLVGTVPVSGQAAPASLADNITGAAADAMAKQASPTVAVIDPSVDGRKTYGALGFSNSAILATAAGAGIRGSAGGFWLAFHGTTRTITSGLARQFLSCADVSLHGWYFSISTAGALGFLCGNVSGFTSSSTYTVVAADLDQPLLVVGVYTGSQVRLYVKRAQVGSDAALAGYLSASGSEPMQVGNWYSANRPADQERAFTVAGGNAVPTLAEVQQLFDVVDQTGRLQAIPGKTDHLWDITADVLASGQEAVPATVLDRIGTDHLTRVGIDVRTDANSIRGVGPYGTADGWQTAIGGGIQGASGGFHVVLDVWLMKVPTTNEVLVHCATNGVSSGWFLQAASASLRLSVVQTGGANPLSSNYTLSASDLGKRLRVMAQRTAGALQLYVNGVQIGADVAISGYVANTNIAMVVGQFYGTQSFSSGYVEVVQGGNTILTAGEIATLNADLTAAPPVIAGKTQKRWVLEQDIATVNGALPSKSTERISGGDDLARIGSPLTLAQRVERVWSYETSPILYGVKAANDNDYYECAGGSPGVASGFFAAALIRIESQAVSAHSRILVTKQADTGNAGWALQSSATNSTLNFVIANGSGTAVASPSAVVSAADVGKLLLVFGVHDGAKVRYYIKRAEQSTGTTVTGYTASAVAMRICRHTQTAGAYADGVTVLAWMTGHAIPSFAEIQAAHDAAMASEDIVAIPGKTDHLWSIKRDVAAAGGALPSTVLDRIGTDHMTKAGSPTLASQYARAWGW